MSDSVRPHRRQPTRLLRPWDFPGKSTGVGCHFLLQCMKVKNEVIQSCPTLSDPMDCSLPGSSIHGIFQARVLEWVAIAFSEVHLYMGFKKNVYYTVLWASQVVLMVKNPPASVGVRDVGLIPGLERSPGGGHGKLLQYSCLENRQNRQKSLAGYSP